MSRRGNAARLLRIVAILAFGYALLLIVTGGFRTEIAGLTIRSHNVERFVMVGVIAWGLAWLIGGRRPRSVVVGGSPSQTLRRTADRDAATGGLKPAGYVRLGLAAVVLAATLWGALQLTRTLPEPTPFGDFALLELYTRDAAAGELHVGPYSRFRWNHPGPAMFYMFSPLYEWSGARLGSLRASALVFNLVMLALLFGILVRRGPPWFASIVILVVALFVLRIPDLLASPWNPHLTVLPMGVLLVACAAIAAGDARLWPLAAALGSFVVQCHLSVAPAVVALVVATVVMVARAEPPAGRRRHAPWLALAGVVALVMWIPPLIHELTAPTSNVGAIVQSFFLDPHGMAPMRDGLAAALRMLAAPIVPGLDLAWGGTVITSVGLISMLIAVGSLTTKRWTATRLAPAGSFPTALVWLSLWASIAALWFTSRIRGEVMDQLVFWITIVGAINLACLAAAVFRGAAERRLATASPNLVPVVLLGLTLVITAVMGAQQVRHASVAYAADTVNAPRVREESTALIAHLEREGLRAPLVRLTQGTWSDAAGVILALEKRGITTTVEPDWIFMFSPSAASTGREDSEIVISGLEGHPRLRAADFSVVGEWSGVSIHVSARRRHP